MDLISILGPTSSGKSSLAIELAKEFNRLHGQNSAVIVSCDSRQVYKYLDIGTGKVVGEWLAFPKTIGITTQNVFTSDEIPHFLIDYIDPMQSYGLLDYLKDFKNLIRLWDENRYKPKYIILCGGTGLYAKAIFDEYNIEEFDPRYENTILELKLELNQFDANELQKQLSLFLPNFESLMNESDRQNPRRLINQIIRYKAKENGWILDQKLDYPKFEHKFQFYLNPSDLRQRLEIRLNDRFAQGLISEVENLLQKNILTIPRLLDLGLEYRQFYFYFQGLQTFNDYHKNIFHENWQYIKRQITWFKKQNDLIEIKDLSDILKVLNY